MQDINHLWHTPMDTGNFLWVQPKLLGGYLEALVIPELQAPCSYSGLMAVLTGCSRVSAPTMTAP